MGDDKERDNEFVREPPEPIQTIDFEAAHVEFVIGRLELTVDENGRPHLKLDGNEVHKVTGLVITGGIDDVWRWRGTIESIIDPRLQDKDTKGE